MTKEEKELKKDILFCLNTLQRYISDMAIGNKISAQNTRFMSEFGNEVAIVTDKCKKANICLNIGGNGK